MNPDRAKKLNQLIVDSALLSEPEKIEWQSMLTLMNDKQVADLEDILTSKSRDGSVASIMPKLSHISNLPTNVVKASAAPEPRPIPSATNNPGSLINQLGISQSRPSAEVKVMKAPPLKKERWMPTPERPQDVPPPPPNSKVNLDNLEAVQALSIAAVRATGFDVIRKQLSELVGQYNYFYVLSALEQSALYHSYIQAGATMLRNGVLEPTQTVLSKDEFEKVADLLSNLQFSA